MLKKIITLERTPTINEKRSMQRSLAELPNVQDVAFDHNHMILHLYRRIPAEILMEEIPSPLEVPVVSVE